MDVLLTVRWQHDQQPSGRVPSLSFLQFHALCLFRTRRLHVVTGVARPDLGNLSFDFLCVSVIENVFKVRPIERFHHDSFCFVVVKDNVKFLSAHAKKYIILLACCMCPGRLDCNNIYARVQHWYNSSSTNG